MNRIQLIEFGNTSDVMTKILTRIFIFFLLYSSFVGYAQTIPPPYINYQAILYDVNGPNPNAPYALQSFPAYINLNDELGNLLYREEHFSSTDANGQVTIKIGDGLYLAGPITNFNQINWASGKYYLVVEFDINGSISSTAPEQLVTVPYAFYAGKAGNGISTITSNGNQTLTITYDNGTTYTTQALAGFEGPQGPTGPQGATGQSAYDLWLAQGNTGTVDDFLNASAYEIWLAQGNTGTQQDFLNTLVGPQGPQGISNNSMFGTKRFLSNGSWICPQNVYKVHVTAIGGGGGGGGNFTSGGGSGGGSGAYVEDIVDVIPGNTYNIIIGSGGLGGLTISGQTAGGNGGNTSFHGLVVANGGTGGNLNSLIGIGGSSTSVNGFAINGNNGTNASSNGGSGGNTPFPYGIIYDSAGNGGGSGGATCGSNGISGKRYGGGGGGGGSGSGCSGAGGSGHSGLLILKF